MTSAPNIIAIPFFLAEGSHTTIDVVRELGLNENGDFQKQIQDRQVFYTPPVGLTDKLLNLILELAITEGCGGVYATTPFAR
jgi:sirohydrochlorin ferrochelatase